MKQQQKKKKKKREREKKGNARACFAWRVNKRARIGRSCKSRPEEINCSCGRSALNRGSKTALSLAASAIKRCYFGSSRSQAPFDEMKNSCRHIVYSLHYRLLIARFPDRVFPFSCSGGHQSVVLTIVLTVQRERSIENQLWKILKNHFARVIHLNRNLKQSKTLTVQKTLTTRSNFCFRSVCRRSSIYRSDC